MAFDPDNFELGQTRDNWQHEVASRMDAAFRDSFFSRVTDSAVPTIRSQGGLGAGLALTCCPTCVTKMEALFRVTLMHRLQLPLPLTCVPAGVASLSTLWATTEQRARARVLGKRGWALESVAARICREGGGRVTTNMLLRDLDLGFVGSEAVGRRLEIVVDGLSLFSGAQLAVDTTLVCAVRRAHHPTAVEDGVRVTRA